MPVTMLCPNLKCRKVLQVPDEVRGKQVRCSHCGSLIAVPTSGQRTPASKGAASRMQNSSSSAQRV